MQFAVDGHFHADPHPGNLMVQTNTGRHKGRVGAPYDRIGLILSSSKLKFAIRVLSTVRQVLFCSRDRPIAPGWWCWTGACASPSRRRSGLAPSAGLARLRRSFCRLALCMAAAELRECLSHSNLEANSTWRLEKLAGPILDGKLQNPKEHPKEPSLCPQKRKPWRVVRCFSGRAEDPGLCSALCCRRHLQCLGSLA